MVGSWFGCRPDLYLSPKDRRMVGGIVWLMVFTLNGEESRRVRVISTTQQTRAKVPDPVKPPARVAGCTFDERFGPAIWTYVSTKRWGCE